MTIISLNAASTLHPQPDTTITVVEGELLVFVELANGRRLPLATLTSGDVMAGCDPTDAGARLLVTAQQGTSIEESDVAHVWSKYPPTTGDVFDSWVHALGQAALNGRWATKVVAPEPMGSLRLAPGEAVVSTATPVPSSNRSVLGWLKVTSGSAQFCGWSNAPVGVIDAAVPMTRGVWLTSGLRCQISLGEPPSDAAGWTRALNLMGRLGLEAVSAIDRDGEETAASVRFEAEEVIVAQTLAGVDLLAGAAVGTIARPRTVRDSRSAALIAAFATLENAGFTVDPLAWDRAQAQVDVGRDSFDAAASASQARARRIHLAPQWWRREGPPLVAETREGDVLALRWTGRTWTFADTRSPGEYRPITEEDRDLLNGRAWEFIPSLPVTPVALSALLRLGIRRSGRDMVTIGVLTVGLAALAFFTPFLLGKVAGSVSNIDPRAVLVALVTLFLLLIVGAGWQYVRSVALLRIRVRGTAVASGAIWDRMMRLRTTWHDKRPMGDRLVQSMGVNNSATAVPDAVIIGLLDTVAILGGLAAVATTSPALLLVTLVLVVVQLLTNLWITRISAERTRARVTAQAAAQGRLLETLRAVSRLRVSGAQSRAFKRWSIVQADLTRTDLAVRRITVTQTIVISAWPVIGLIAIVIVSGLTGASFGEFVTAQTALAIATTTLAATAISAAAIFNGRAILSKVEQVLAATPEGGSEGIEPGRISGEVTFNDIVFRYNPEARAVLDGVTFSVKPGEQVAIVGPSGCGKTTLMRILLGLEEPESGVITIDGQDLGVLDRPSFRRQVGSVLQSSTLLPGPIRDNVDMGRGLTSKEIWQALEWACVADEVRAMGMGLDTPVVDGGGTVSGGQRQRILLARALACNPRMLILDEATSALDNVTQGSIVEHLENLRLTRILIAHRLSTIQGADRIIVIAGGRVAQQGTFDDLVSQPGHFADLVQRQVT